MIHSLDTEIAEAYGVTEALMINNILFWVVRNEVNHEHQHDGRTWTYNSAEAFTKLFTYLSAKQIRRTLGSLVDQGVLLKGCYNENPFNRSLWYAFTDEFRAKFAHLFPAQNGEKTHANESKNQAKTDDSIFPDGKTYIFPDGKITRQIENQIENKYTKEPACGELPAQGQACDDVPHQKILNLWAEHLPQLIQPSKWTPSRKAALRARWNEDRDRQKPEWWAALFQHIGKNDFLMGRSAAVAGRRAFEVDLDWLLKQSNLLKVIEGKYDN